MCHRNLNIRYIFLTKIKSFSYRNHSYLYSPFNMGVNVFQNHLICEYLTWQLIPATIYSQGQPCSYKTRSGKPPRGEGLQGLSLCLSFQRPRGPDEGGGTGWAAAPLAGAWRAEMGRAARVQRGRPRPVPHLSAVSVWTTPLRGAGDLGRVRFGE